MHDKKEVSATEKKKPAMVLDYNRTKAGVDTMDQMVRTYTTKRKSRRWPMTVFYNILDVSALNSYVIWIHANPEWKAKVPHKRRLFLEALGKDLMQEYRQKREQREQQTPGHQQQLTARAVAVVGKRGRCVVCPRSVDLKHSIRCSKCMNFVCKNHLVCSKCQSTGEQN